MTTTERLRRAMRESEARERRRAATREEFDSDLSAEDLARGTMGETWIMDEIEKATSGPWKYPVRSQPSRSGPRWVIIASVLFWAGVLLVVL